MFLVCGVNYIVNFCLPLPLWYAGMCFSCFASINFVYVLPFLCYILNFWTNSICLLLSCVLIYDLLTCLIVDIKMTYDYNTDTANNTNTRAFKLVTCISVVCKPFAVKCIMFFYFRKISCTRKQNAVSYFLNIWNVKLNCRAIWYL